MTKGQNGQIDRMKWVKEYNIAVLRHGGKNEKIMYTWFAGDDGFYYDPVGDEIFEVRRIGGTDHQPHYAIDFGDEVVAGAIKDHGLHEYLGEGDWRVLDLRKAAK